METNLSKAIDITNDTARYDESVKELLADKQVLARILKYSVEEFAELSLDEIIKSISEPDIAGIRVEPGMTNLGKVEKQSEEDFVPGEGKNIYDIRFVAYLGTEMIKFLINVEAQKSTKHYDLGYHLDNRIIFYLSRMISAQKEIEFFNSDYDNIKAVRSIWICMDSNADEDSINRIRFVQENVYGKMMELANLDKVQGIIIRLRQKENVESSKNYLIAMLEELLKKGDKEKKKKIVQGMNPAIRVTKLYQTPFSCPRSYAMLGVSRWKKRPKFSASTTLRKLSPPCFQAAIYQSRGKKEEETPA